MEQNYFRLICLFTDIAPRVLQKALEEQWQHSGYSSFVELLNQEKHKFYHCLYPGRDYQLDTCCCGSNKESNKSMTTAQWELLYEYIGSNARCSYTGKHPCKHEAKVGVKLEELDITLLRLIFKKLFSGNASLEKIHKLRNKLFHSATDSVSDAEFRRVWFSARSNILQIVNTSAVPFPADIKREIDKLETRSLDPSECERLLKVVKHLTDTGILLEGISSDLNIVKHTTEFTDTNVRCIKAGVESLVANMEKPDRSRHSELERRIENTESELKSHKKSLYVSLGTAERKSYKRLQEKHLVTISGRAGSGKTSLGKQLLIKYCDEHTQADGSPTYTSVIISKPEDFDKIGSKDRLVVFIDDPFGASNIDDNVLKEWEKHFEKMSSYCKEGNIRIIIGVRSNLISEPEKIFRKIDLFAKMNIIDLSSQHKLSSEEKLHMLKAYCKKYEVQIIGDTTYDPRKISDSETSSLKNIQMSVLSQISELDLFEGFPLACYRFFSIQSLFEQGAYFFTHAAESLTDEISKLEKREPVLYLTLAYMLLEGGKIDLNKINEQKLRGLNEVLEQEYKTVAIKDCCECEMNKVYLERVHMTQHRKRQEKPAMIYRFTHQTVLEAVLLSLITRHTKLVLMLSNYRIIAEFVRPSKYNQNRDEICENIPPEYDRLLAERVIRNGCFFIPFYRGVSDASFAEVLLDVMETTETLYGYSGTQIRHEHAILGLLMVVGIDQSSLLKAVFTRYTHNGHGDILTGTELKSTLQSKKKIIDLDEYVRALNRMLEKKVSSVEQLIMSFQFNPMCDYQYKDRNGSDRTMVPLCYAAEEELKHVVLFWIKNNGTVEKEGHLCKLLEMCCRWDWTDVVTVLIQNDSHETHKKLLSPAYIYRNARETGKQMVGYLLQNNIDSTLTDKSGNTMLHYCSEYGLKTEIKSILETRPEIINVQNKKGETAICLAAKHRKKYTVKELLQHSKSSIDITLPDKDGNTVLHYCSKYGFETEVLGILQKHP